MRIIVNHLTRMQSGLICVAGLNVETGQHVRPVVRGVGLGTNLLARNGGPFEIGAIVDLGRTLHLGEAPQTEDFLFDARRARRVENCTPDQFWTLLADHARPKLRDIFGNDLLARGPQSCATDVGKGKASLGCLIPASRPQIYLRSRPDRRPQIRLQVSDGDFNLDLGVTDIRLYGPDHLTPDSKALEKAEKRLRDSAEIILAVGLTRPYAPSPDQPPLHWLQVNNIHVREEPVWRLA